MALFHGRILIGGVVGFRPKRNRSAAEWIVEVGPIADVARKDGIVGGDVVVHAPDQIILLADLGANLLYVSYACRRCCRWAVDNS